MNKMTKAATALKTAPKTKAAPKPVATAKAGTGRGRASGQTQNAAAADVADATSVKAVAPKPAPAPVKAATPAPKAPLVGGTAQAVIEVRAIPPKPYRQRAVPPEAYPFSILTPAVKTKAGEIEGPSFFIPDTDGADKKLTNARKKYRPAGILFWSRKTAEQVKGKGPVVAGMRIWRGTPEVKPK